MLVSKTGTFQKKKKKIILRVRHIDSNFCSGIFKNMEHSLSYEDQQHQHEKDHGGHQHRGPKRNEAAIESIFFAESTQYTPFEML